MTREIMSLEEAAEYLGLNKRTVYNLVKKGVVPATKIGRQWRAKKENIDSMFKESRKTTQLGENL